MLKSRLFACQTIVSRYYKACIILCYCDVISVKVASELRICVFFFVHFVPGGPPVLFMHVLFVFAQQSLLYC